MTSPMMEKAARTVDPWAFDPDNGSALVQFHQERAYRTGKAVLLAVRELGPEIEADETEATVWREIIDAILSTDTAEGVKP